MTALIFYYFLFILSKINITLKNNRFYSSLPTKLKNLMEVILCLDIIFIKISLRRAKLLDDILYITFKSRFSSVQIREEIKNLLLIFR